MKCKYSTSKDRISFVTAAPYRIFNRSPESGDRGLALPDDDKLIVTCSVRDVREVFTLRRESQTSVQPSVQRTWVVLGLRVDDALQPRTRPRGYLGSFRATSARTEHRGWNDAIDAR